MDLDFNQQAVRVMPATHRLSVTDLHENSDILVIRTRPRHVRAKHLSRTTQDTARLGTIHTPAFHVRCHQGAGQEERVVLPKDPAKRGVWSIKAPSCGDIPCGWYELG